MIAHAAQILLVLVPLALLARNALRLAHFTIGMVCYLLIWFLFPKTWRAMHDEEIRISE